MIGEKKVKNKIKEYEILQNKDPNSLNNGDWYIKIKGTRRIIRYYENLEEARAFVKRHKIPSTLEKVIAWVITVVVSFAVVWFLGTFEIFH